MTAGVIAVLGFFWFTSESFLRGLISLSSVPSRYEFQNSFCAVLWNYKSMQHDVNYTVKHPFCLTLSVNDQLPINTKEALTVSEQLWQRQRWCIWLNFDAPYLLMSETEDEIQPPVLRLRTVVLFLHIKMSFRFRILLKKSRVDKSAARAPWMND